MDGLYLVDKPAGPSSFGVLRGLRPALGRKLGHAGTLDPFATGLLLVLSGRATRLAAYLSGLDKRYTATVRFGAVSATHDPEGPIEETGRRVSAGAVGDALAPLVGELLQAVPAASAVRVGGERSYARMRRGETVVAEPRRVRIDALELVAFDEAAQEAVLDVRCSKGTYVRQLAADLGDGTGAGAYCAALRRTEVGVFGVAEAGTPDEVAAAPEGRWFRPPREALPHLPERALEVAEADDVAHGRALARRHEEGPTRLVRGGRLVAVAEPAGDRLRPTLVLGA